MMVPANITTILLMPPNLDLLTEILEEPGTLATQSRNFEVH